MSVSTLPSRLAKKSTAVIYLPRTDDPLKELKGAVDRRYVHVKFTATKGGTELGFPIDSEGSDLSGADWERGSGTIHVEGDLKLDGVRVRCMADLDIATMKGKGRLRLLDA